MKTIRTTIATLSATLLLYAIVAWVSVRRNAAFIQRTIYQGFDQTFVVALVMGCAFLLIAIILTVAIVSTGDAEDEDEEDEDEEPLPLKPKARPRSGGEQKPSSRTGEGAYRKASHARAGAQGQEDGGFARPKGEPQRRKAPKAPAPDDPADIPLRRGETTRKPQPAPRAAAARDASGETAAPSQDPAIELAAPAKEARAEKASAPGIEEAPAVATETAPVLDAEAPEAVPAPAIEEAPAQPAVEAEAPVEEDEEGDQQTEREEAPAPEPAGEQPEPEAPAKGEEPAKAQVPAPEPVQEEATIRCVFCGSSIRRDSVYCPRCGKKL